LLAHDAPAAPERSDSAATTRDLVFLAEERPVFVRLRITTGGRPFDEGWTESVRALFATLDKDGDGKLTVKEADASTLGALVRLATSSATTLSGELSLDVAPKDGTVSVDELALVLRPVLGPFRVQFGRLANGRTDALFDHLDRDKDGQLTKAELAAIAGSVRRLDLDDNEMITPDELEPFNNPAVVARAEGAADRRARFTAVPPAIELTAGESSLRLARLILRKYDKGRGDVPSRPDGKLSADEFAIHADAFAGADANGDGVLDTEELRKYLAGAPVDLVLDVAFPASASGQPTTRIGNGSGRMPKEFQVRQLALGDVEFAVGRVRLDIAVDGGVRSAANARRFALRRFRAADKNNDGYLEKQELEALNAQNSPLAGLTGLIDRNGDGKLYEKELSEFVDRQLAAAQGRLVLTIADQGRAIFGIVDLDRDRRLSAREVMRTVDRVSSWDRDGDGRITADEIPYHFLVVVARGELAGLDGDADAGAPAAAAARASAVPPPPSAEPAAGPEWFRLMDRNRDGDVSAREFLGPREQFDRLDKDRDGLIDAQEASSATPAPKGDAPKRKPS
jgi:Ca2+-binding EF-hand superfamily protein